MQNAGQYNECDRLCVRASWSCGSGVKQGGTYAPRSQRPCRNLKGGPDSSAEASGCGCPLLTGRTKRCACRFITEGHLSTSRDVFVRTRESSRSLPTHCGPRHHTRRTKGAVVRSLSEGSLRQRRAPHAHKQLTHPQESPRTNRPQKRNT